MKIGYCVVALLMTLAAVGSRAAETAPTTDKELLARFETGLKAKDKTALLQLFNWEGVSAEVREMQEKVIGWIVQEPVNSVTMSPLPPAFKTEFTRGNIHYRPNVTVTGIIVLDGQQNMGNSKTQIPFGQKNGFFYISNTVEEKMATPAAAAVITKEPATPPAPLTAGSATAQGTIRYKGKVLPIKSAVAWWEPNRSRFTIELAPVELDKAQRAEIQKSKMSMLVISKLPSPDPAVWDWCPHAGLRIEFEKDTAVFSPAKVAGCTLTLHWIEKKNTSTSYSRSGSVVAGDFQQLTATTGTNGLIRFHFKNSEPIGLPGWEDASYDITVATPVWEK